MAIFISGWGQARQGKESESVPKTPNPISAKPFIERLVPGITFQSQRKNRGGLDFNPFLGYRISRRLTAGLGWNERFGFHFRHHFGLSHRRGVYGPRSFVDFKVLKGFSLRGEIEKMNTFVPPLPGLNPPGDPGSREWVWGVFLGIKKDFRLTEGLRANIQVLYNLYDDVYYKSPYADRLNLRVGLEFPLKKRIKEPQKP
jgi:hypothetical protein